MSACRSFDKQTLQGEPAPGHRLDGRGGRTGGRHVPYILERLRPVPRHPPWRADRDDAERDGAWGGCGALPAAERIHPYSA